MWDVWLSMLWLPAVTVADELKIFDALNVRPASAEQLAADLGLNPRAVSIVLPLLAALGFLVVREGTYGVSETSRNFLLHEGPFYWGHVFAVRPRQQPMHLALKNALLKRDANPVPQSSDRPPVEAWESGQLDVERARFIAAFMHSHSMPAAVGVALHGKMGALSRLLDVGGGSGCFSIALAKVHPHLRCTVMDLPAMCEVAQGYISKAGMSDRVDTRSVDMFRQRWPEGYDGILMSNIFHDWSFETCAQLAARAFDVLPPGGRICVHELLLNDDGVSPVTAAAFSVLMLLGTRGQQFTYAQLRKMLEQAGFSEISVTSTYGYYSLVQGVKR